MESIRPGFFSCGSWFKQHPVPRPGTLTMGCHEDGSGWDWTLVGLAREECAECPSAKRWERRVELFLVDFSRTFVEDRSRCWRFKLIGLGPDGGNSKMFCTIHHSPCCLIGTSLEQFTLISQIHRLYHCYHCHWSLLSIVITILYHRLWICVLSFLCHFNRKTHSQKRHFSSTHPGANWHSLRQRASDKFFGGCTGSPFSTLEQWTNPWLFREYGRLYYPVMWGLW